MPDDRLVRWLMGRDGGARDGALRALLSAAWSFLQHAPITIEGHLSALEERLQALEARLVGDFRTALDTGVTAVEETVAGVEHRLEQDFDRVVRARIVAIQARLEAVKSHVVEELKHELRRMALVMALVMGCGVLALISGIFGLMAAWTELTSFIGSAGASLVLAIVFLLGSLTAVGTLRSVLRRSQGARGVPKIAT